MQSSDLRWDDMRVLLALVRKGSLKQAAGDLGVNISTVSRRLDAMEASLEVHLFDRTSDGTRPTAAAEQLVPYAETMEQAAAGISRTLEGYEAEPEGLVRLTAPPGVAEQLLARSFGSLMKRYPKIQVELSSSVAYADLTRREADIALRAIRPATGDLVATKLASSPFTIVASPKLARALGRLKDPGQTTWVNWGPTLAHLEDARWISARVPDEQVVLRSGSVTVLLEAARSGLGVMLAPHVFATLNGLAEVQLAPGLRRAVAELEPGSLWLVGHRALRDVPRIAAVWDWLRGSFELAS